MDQEQHDWEVDAEEDEFYELPRLPLLLVQYRQNVCRLTQVDLGRKPYNIDQSQLSDWENGRAVPRDVSLRRLAIAFSDHCDQPADRIFQYLVEARDQKALSGPTEDAEELVLRDLLRPLPKRFRRHIWGLLLEIGRAQVALIEMARGHRQRNP